MQRKKIAVSGFIGLVLGIAASASAALSSAGESTVKFEAQGPAGMKINGVSGGIHAIEADGKIKIVAPTTEFRTGIGLRDKHTREYLEAEAHPQATLVIDRAKIALPAGSPSTGTLTGDLTLHGVTHPAAVSYRIAKAGADYQVHGTLDVKIADYKIKKPCYLGVCVGDDVKIVADFGVHGD